MSDGAEALKAKSSGINTDPAPGENLKYLVCENGVTKNTPACEYASEADKIDEYLGSFWRQLGDFNPFHTPHRVLYCQDVKPILDKLCFPVSKKTQQKLQETMEGPLFAGPPAPFPSVYGIYVMLTEPAQELTPDQITERDKQQLMLDKHIQAKAFKIYEQLIRIKQLRETNNPDMQTASMNFVSGLKFVCVEDNWLAIGQRKDKCDKTVETYEKNWGRLKTVGLWLAGGGIAAWAVVKRFFSSGRSSEVLEKAAKKLEESKKAGKGPLRRLLSAWDYVVRRAHGTAEEPEADQAGTGAGTVTGAGAGAETGAGGGTGAGAGTVKDPPMPTYQGPVDEVQATSDLTAIANNAEKALHKFSEVAQTWLPKARDRDTAGRIGADTDLIVAEFTSPEDRAKRFSPLLRSETTIDFLNQLGQLFEQEFATTVIDAAETMTRLFEKPDAEITSGLNQLDEKLKKLEVFKNDMVALSQLVRSSLGSILHTMKNTSPNFATNYKNVHTYLKRILLEKDRIIAVLRSQTALANAPEQFKKDHRFEASSLSSAATLASWFNKPLATSYEVELKTSISGNVIIPPKDQRLVLAMMYKPTRNAVRHSRVQEDGSESLVRTSSTIEGTTLTITIEDNGQGLSAEQEAEITAEGLEGEDETLESAVVRGQALFERQEKPAEDPPESSLGRIFAECRRRGWQANTFSQGGQGTAITFKIDLKASGWKVVDTEKVGGGSSGPEGGAPGAGQGLAGLTPSPRAHPAKPPASQASSRIFTGLVSSETDAFAEMARSYIETLRAQGVELSPLAEAALASHYITAMQRSGGNLIAVPQTQLPFDMAAATLLQMGTAANTGFGTVALPVTGMQSFIKLP